MSEPSLQTELSRLQCLQALGITVYHPRFRLPGAKPSVQGPWPDANAVLESGATGKAAQAERAPAVERMSAAERMTAAERMAAAEKAAMPVASAALAETPRADAVRGAAKAEPAAQPTRRVEVDLPTAPARNPAAPRAADTASEKAGAPSAVQNFQLLFLQVDDDLAIVNQVPALARPQLQEKQMALLANMLRWLGKSVPAQTPRVFRWPLPGLEHMAASMNPQTSLLHFLEQAASERGFRFLLQLGPQAVAPAASAWQSFATHSLDEMLALPSLKREVWQTLLPLHDALR